MRKVCILISVIVIAMTIGTAVALPEILDIFNIEYHAMGTRLDTCDTCHIPNKPQKPACDEVCHVPKKVQKEYDSLNPYGMDVKNNLNIELNQALIVIENLDSDKDGYTNIDEIHNLTFPGRKNDKPKKGAIADLLDILNFPIP